MLPLVLGGVALAAVGYGLKEYCESEGCPWDEPSYTYRHKTGFDTLYDTKVDVYEYGIKTFKEVMSHIKTLPSNFTLKYDADKFEKEVIEDASSVFDLAESIAKDASDVLEKAQAMMHSRLTDIQSILSESSDYATYSDTQKSTIKSTYKLAKKITAICNAKIVNVNNQINAKLIDKLNKVKRAYETFEVEKEGEN